MRNLSLAVLLLLALPGVGWGQVWPGGSGQAASISGTGYPTAACSVGQTFLATDTGQIWDCTDGVSVWTNRTTGVTSSGAAAYSAGLLSRYAMADCTSTTIPDTSGNGNTGTFATGNPPNYGAAPTCSSGVGVIFNGAYTPGTPQNYGTAQFIALPAAAINGSQTDIIYVLPASTPSLDSQTLLYPATAASPTNGRIALRPTDNNPVIGLDGVPVYAGASQPWQGVMPLAVSHCGTTAHLYYQGTEVTGYSFPPISTAAFSGATAAYIGTDVSGYFGSLQGTMYYEEHFSGCLTAAQIKTEMARINVILQGRGLTLGNQTNKSKPLVVWDGTSITAGFNIYTAQAYFMGGQYTYVGYTNTAFGNIFNFIDNGISGQTLGGGGGALAKIQTTDLSQIPGNTRPVVILDFPTNDLLGATPASATAAEASIQTACAAVQAAGAWAIATTVLPATVGGSSATFSANRALWNTWIRANFATYCNGLADPASDPVIGPDSAASNTTYYAADGRHLLAAAHAIAAPYYEAAISKVTGIQPINGPTCVSNASPAVCGAAISGIVSVAAGTDPTLVVNTTLVKSLSRITLNIDQSLGTALGVTCNTTLANNAQPFVTARTVGISFTIEVPAVVATNPVCVSWSLVN